MKCPYCGYNDSKVIDSRETNDAVRRRRQCLSCSSRFSTLERMEASPLFVIKKDGRREEFNRSKLIAGMRKACEKRPLAAGAVDKIADDIEAELHNPDRIGMEIPSTVIGEMVMERLKSLDHIAYIRFASVYREFADIESLKQEVDTLLRSTKSPVPPASQLALIPPEEFDSTSRGREGNRKKKIALSAGKDGDTNAKER